MTVIDQPRHIPESADLIIENRLHKTLERLNSQPHGVSLEATIESLQGPYEEWLETKEIVFPGGLWLEKDTPAEASFMIPAEFDYDGSGPIYRLHFVPYYTATGKDEHGNETQERQAASETVSGQKFAFMSAGLNDALEYVTLVEAKLLPKPNYLVGTTNPNMGRFAEKLGLKTISGIATDMAKDKAIDIDRDDEEYVAMGSKLDKMLDHDEMPKHFDLDPDDIKGIVRHLIKEAALHKRDWQESQHQDAISLAKYEDAVWLANSFAYNYFDDDNDKWVVWGRYEDFRDAVLKFNEKLGEKIYKKIYKLAQNNKTVADSTSVN